MEVLIMDQGTEFGADIQHLCQSSGDIARGDSFGNAVAKFCR